jgi:hypothetical protein
LGNNPPWQLPTSPIINVTVGRPLGSQRQLPWNGIALESSRNLDSRRRAFFRLLECLLEDLSVPLLSSRIQQRVNQLEKEKMVLSMSKAPLEARFRQKEDAWKKEQSRLHHEIDSLMKGSQEADDVTVT